MHELRIAIALFVTGTVLGSLIRVARGPTFADRILVSQLFGTTGVAVLLLLAADPARAALRDVALIFALLAPITVAAFVRYASPRWTTGDRP